MAKELMYRLTLTAKSRFMHGDRDFSLYGVKFSIEHQHHNQYAVIAKGMEILRIIGDSHACAVMEV